MNYFVQFLRNLFGIESPTSSSSYLSEDDYYGTKSVASPLGKVNPTNASMLVTGHSGNIGAGSWNEIIAKKYNMKRINLAVGGKQTNTDLKVVSNWFSNPSVKSPNIVFIYSGLNDIWSGRSVDWVASNQQAIIDLVRSRGAKKVYFILGYDGAKVNNNISLGGFPRGTTNEMIQGYVKKFANYQSQIQSKLKNVDAFVPVIENITRSDSYDGLHLNSNGSKKFANAVDTYLFSLQGQKLV
jgi:hypothetical protein